MAHMNCGGLAARPAVFEAVIAQHALRALKALEALRRPADGDSMLADESHGPGWFESSWELVNGLDISEGLPADAGLDEWLAVCLAR
jgi:hypothetical protein